MIPPPSDRSTQVELFWIAHRIERWIRFGRQIDEQILDRRRRFVSFEPGSVFAYVRWAANDYGTVVSRIDILRAPGPGEAFSTVPFVHPGGAIYLRQSGWPKVQCVLEAIDAVEQLGIDPADACPDHWCHIHNRLAAGEAPRAYTIERHHAWLRRQKIGA